MKTLQPMLFVFFAALFSSNVMAVILFDDDFDEPDINGAHNNFAGLDNWTITDGTVDAFVNGGFGLSCPSAGCLDLDGSTTDAVTMNTNTVFNFLSSELYRITANVSGNQRGQANDTLSVNLSGILGLSSIFQSDDPFAPFSIAFSGVSGSSAIQIDHEGGDNFGVILDRVTLCTIPDFDTLTCDNGTTVPEPTTLTLFALGLAGLGFARRKKA